MAITLILRGCHELQEPKTVEQRESDTALEKEAQFCYSVVYSFNRSSSPRKMEILGEIMDLMVVNS